MYAIDVAIDAVDLLRRSRTPSKTLLPLQWWLRSDDPIMPDRLARALLAELREHEVQAAPSLGR
jgi:hypothetical protein